MKLGFIGCGKMATALVQGVLKAGVCAPGDITASDTIPAASEKLAKDTGIKAVLQNIEVFAASEVLVLAVKPGDAIIAIQSLATQQLESTMRWAWKTAGDQSRLLISIVAGLPIEKLEAAAGERFRIIRAMPNTPALILQGATAFALGSRATAADTAIAHQIFNSVGLAEAVNETLLDAVTGLSGSGPAYVYTIIEALADGGVLMGLPRDLALRLAAQTVAGGAQMVLQTGQHPAPLRDQVASPGGTTIAGLECLERNGLRGALMAAVRAAAERARELGSAK
jgi:pyrroline-5-carboxylate reductase